MRALKKTIMKKLPLVALVVPFWYPTVKALAICPPLFLDKYQIQTTSTVHPIQHNIHGSSYTTQQLEAICLEGIRNKIKFLGINAIATQDMLYQHLQPSATVKFYKNINYVFWVLLKRTRFTLIDLPLKMPLTFFQQCRQPTIIKHQLSRHLEQLLSI